MKQVSDILVEKVGVIGRIRLNRPKALNSLNLEMVQTITTALTAFEADAGIAAVLITGEGDRGLCAGGDIRALYDHGRDGSGFGEMFFRDEYRMNAQISHFKKPYIAVMSGIVMGGGVGVSAHGSVRITTDVTRMAMPETGIGFFPDIGATYMLSHAPGEIGTFLGLTGESFSGADAIYAGLADYFVQNAEIQTLIKALEKLPVNTKLADVQEIVSEFANPPHSTLATHRAEIDALFAFDTVEEIITALNASGSDFARKTLAVMAQKSPTSMKLTLKLLRLAKQDARLEDSLEREFICTQGVLASDEFYEGVRAAVVDKDRQPKWSPAKLHDVSATLVDSYFAQTVAKLF